MESTRLPTAEKHLHVADAVRTRCIYEWPKLRKHIKSALRRNLQEIAPSPANDGVAVLCGSGPSIAGFTKEIQAHKDNGHTVIAIKGAHDFLINKGVIPHAALAIDPQPKIYHTFTPHKDVTYMLASQVHPAVFNRLKDNKILLFHMFTGDDEQSLLEGHHLIGGGSTSGMRAITLAFTIGIRKIHLYGFDSCMNGDLRKITGEGQQHKKVIPVRVGDPVNGPLYMADLAMASQADEFEKMLGFLTQYDSSFHITTHGEGLIQEIARQREKLGLPGCHAD